MGETVWKYLVEDLRAENHTAEANNLDAIFKRRAEVWSARPAPFGSEQAWDCTGQEGVYLWSKFVPYHSYTALTQQNLWVHEYSNENHRVNPRVHANCCSLGVERERTTLLGLHVGTNLPLRPNLMI